jgi:hypothetical protein
VSELFLAAIWELSEEKAGYAWNKKSSASLDQQASSQITGSGYQSTGVDVLHEEAVVLDKGSLTW